MQKYCPKCFKKFPLDVERCPEDGTYLVAPMDKDLVGEILDDRYTVLEQIGKGGMGVVYRAEQHLIKRIVALKVLRREIVQDESAVKRFLNEARAIASLDSRHTITLHDFGVTRDGLLYYTMELLKGRPLSRIIRDEAPLDHVRAAGLLLQACRSLEEAHEHNILHRDLKPENLFVSVKKGKEQLKVLDFGIAKLLGDTASETLTQAGMIVGTPQYLSPEQAKGKPVAQPSDLYSLGIVLYEMLTGEPPFLCDTPMATLWAHIQDPVPPLHQKNPNIQVPRSIEVFLARALEKEAANRFQSASAFGAALRKAVEDHDASPETVTLPPLATTDQGLRLRTQAWTPEEVAGAGGDLGTPNEIIVEEAGELGTALLGALGVEPSPPQAEPPKDIVEGAQTSSHGGSEVNETPEEVGSAETAWATEVPVVAPPAPESTAQPDVPMPEPAPTPLPPEDSSLSVPGPETLEVLSAGRRPAVWAGAAAVAVALCVALLVWHPWTGGDAAEAGSGREAPVALGTSPDEREETAKALRRGSGQAEEQREAEKEAADRRLQTAEEEKRKKAEEERQADLSRRSLEAKAEEARKKAAEEAETARQAEEAQKAEEARKAAETEAARRVEEERKTLDAQQKAEEAKKAEKAREEAAEAEAARRAEDKRKAEAAKRREEADAKKKRSGLQMGRKEMQGGRYEKAIALFNEAKQEGADVGKADRLIKKCYDQIRKREIRSLVGKGSRAYGEKRWTECVKHLEAAVKLGGSTSEVEEKLKKCRAMTVF
jgi:serine/threonine protein kinase